MRLLRVAVEKKRWDLVAHSIILATASVLKNGDKPPTNKRIANNLAIRNTAVKRATKSGRKRV